MDLHYLNHADVQALAMTDAEILGAVEEGLRAQGRGEAVIEPRMHLVPEKDYPGHFNVLRDVAAHVAMIQKLQARIEVLEARADGKEAP